MSRILLVRHGETAWTRDRRVQGWAPVPLTDRGRRQAAATGDHLASEFDVDRIVASDLRRAQETATVVGDACGVPVEYDDRWRERDAGSYQGFDHEVVENRLPTREDGDPGETDYLLAHEGESWATVERRVRSAWDEAASGVGPEDTLAVVSHGGPILVLRADLRGMATERAGELPCSECGVTVVEDGGIVEGDATGHLDGVGD